MGHRGMAGAVAFVLAVALVSGCGDEGSGNAGDAGTDPATTAQTCARLADREADATVQLVELSASIDLEMIASGEDPPEGLEDLEATFDAVDERRNELGCEDAAYGELVCARLVELESTTDVVGLADGC
ncbi:MAG: hypothetical protein S0880_12770 [Actinomycetota bacterium]|nr:hypothetical protein [Actinomycetota bacterium]